MTEISLLKLKPNPKGLLPFQSDIWFNHLKFDLSNVDEIMQHLSIFFWDFLERIPGIRENLLLGFAKHPKFVFGTDIFLHKHILLN